MYYSWDEAKCDVNCYKFTAIVSHSLLSEKYLPPAWSVGKRELITDADLRLSLIILRVTVNWETAKTYLFRINT
jgi:hypothetical protein